MLTGKNAVVVGASRGLGRGVAESLDAAGASVVAVARDRAALDRLAAARPSIRTRVGDATDPSVAKMVLEEHQPDILAVVAGAPPSMRPIHHQTWESFSAPWQVDVQIAFHWLREAMTQPLRPGSRVLLMSSGAATAGSPLSGGYAGAKATVRFMAAYAAGEARREGLGIDVVSVLPRLTPTTGLGQDAVRAYAERRGVSEHQLVEGMGTPLTAEGAGDAFVTLAGADRDGVVEAYALTGDGLSALGAAA